MQDAKRGKPSRETPNEAKSTKRWGESGWNDPMREAKPRDSHRGQKNEEVKDESVKEAVKDVEGDC